MNGDEQVSQVAPFNLHVIAGEFQTHGVGTVRMNKRCGNEVMIWKYLCFAAGRFDAQAGAGGFTVPARWSGRGGSFVDFGVLFHGIGFV